MKGKNILLIIAVLISMVSLSAFSFPAGGGGGSNDVAPIRTISVTGSGKSYLTPNLATISIGVHTEDPDVVKALNDNTAKLQAVSDALKGLGIAQKDIQTTNFSVYPSQQYGPNGEMKELKYAVDNTVTITARDLAKLGDILSKVISQGANNIYGITFDASDRAKALSDARLAAVGDAKAQANELAAAAGVTLGKVQGISVNTSQPVPMYSNYGMGGGGGMAAAAPAPISSGQLLVSVDVSITYEIN
jgi:uncharacterized protein